MAYSLTNLRDDIRNYTEVGSNVLSDSVLARIIQNAENKILRSIDWIEKKYDEFVTNKLTIDQISVACALDYTSFRFTDAWGENNIKLKKWLENITKNDFMKSTLPGESFKYE